jgi:hypothetical protein
MIKVIVELIDGRPFIEFYDNNGITQNKGKHYIYGDETITFDGPKKVNNWTDGNIKFGPDNYTTGGVNFGHNLSIKKVKYKTNNVIIKNVSLTDQVLRFYGTYDPDEILRDLKVKKPLIENSDGHHGVEIDATFEKRTDPCICLQGFSSSYNNYNKTYNQVYKGTVYKTIRAWTWGRSDNSYYINAHNLYISCYGIKTGAKFTMAANNFPYSGVIYGDQTLTTYDRNGRWQNTYMDISTRSDYYRVFKLNYDYGSLDNICVFTGRFQYKRKEEHPGSYISRIDYTRPSSLELSVGAGGSRDTTSNWVYSSNNQVSVKARFWCEGEWTSGVCKWASNNGAWCQGSWNWDSDSSWNQRSYDYAFRHRNVPNGPSGCDGCAYIANWKRTGTCYNIYDYWGGGNQDYLRLQGCID